MRKNWSLRTKFMITMSLLLGLGLGVYLLMAVTSFKDDKTRLVFDLTRSQVSNLTSELETQFQGVSEKLKVFALLPPSLQEKMAGELLTENSSVVAIAIFRGTKEAPDRVFDQDRFLETYGLEREEFHQRLLAAPPHFSEIVSGGEDLWNASLKDGPPLIGYARLVVVQDQKGIPVEQWIVAGYVKLDRFLKSVSTVRLSEILVANQRGEILVHPDAKLLLEHPKTEQDSLFQEALANKTRLSVARREDGSRHVLAAFGKGFAGQLIVVAKADESEVFKVVGDLAVRTLLFGALVLTLVILAAFLISRSLTENIAVLTERMETAAKGDLSTRIQIRGADETIILANTFNQMIGDLKESRDALEMMNRELDQKVKERTLELEEQHRKVKEVQEALVQTTRMASVGEVAGRTAHEVLNPLTIILTRIGLMQKRTAGSEDASLSLIDEIRKAWSEDYRVGGFDKLLSAWREASKIIDGKNLFEEDVENIGRSVGDLKEHSRTLAQDLQFVKDESERIGKIINGLRQMGQSQSEFITWPMHTVLADCHQIMNDLFATKGFRIEQDFRASQDRCLVDRDEMIQAVTNLMRNSLHALEEASALPGRRLILRTRNEGSELLIEVEDNGQGIAPEDQKLLFESGFTTKGPEHGSGLGLGIARRFVRGQGGDVEFVGSLPAEKTVFRLRLPLIAKGVAA